MKETLDVFGGTIKAMNEGKSEDAKNLVLGSTAPISCLEVLDTDLLRNLLKVS
jgi:hypothetical protein